MRKSFDSQMRDPNLRSTRSEIAMTQLRADELLARLDKVKVPPWKLLAAALKKVEMARNPDEREARLEFLFALIRTGADAFASHERTWRELRELFQERAKLVQVEHRIVQDAATTLTAEDAMALISGLLAAVKEVVLDRLGNVQVYRDVCRAALFYLPAEVKQAAGEVIDNPPD
jgi:hypothetical protein